MATPEAGTSKDNNDKVNDAEPQVNGDQVNGANTVESREVTFDQFVETCKIELVDEATPVESIVKRLNNIKERYEKEPIWRHRTLNQVLSHFDYTIRLEKEKGDKQMLFHDFIEEFKRLDKYLKVLISKSEKERAALKKKIQKLQTDIKKDLRKIDKLDQSEIGFEELDSEYSDHMKKEKYEKRVARLAVKLLSLQGCQKTSTRLLDQVYKYTGTDYPALNEAISTKYRAIMQKKYKGCVPDRPVNSTPNIGDIVNIINDVNEAKKLNIQNSEDLAMVIQQDIIKEIQRRRNLEYQEMINDYEHDSHLRPQSFPDLGDEELNKALDTNEVTCKVNIVKMMEAFKRRMEKAGISEDADIEVNEPDEDEEEDEEEEPDEGMVEDEEVSDDGEEDQEAGEAAHGDDDDDDLVILDDDAANPNGEAVPKKEEKPQSSEMKRSIEDVADSQEENSNTKKVKSEESLTQVTSSCEDSSNQNTKPDQSMDTNEEMPKKEEKKITEEASSTDNQVESSSEKLESIKQETNQNGNSPDQNNDNSDDLEDEELSKSNSSDKDSQDRPTKISTTTPTKLETHDSIAVVDLESETKSYDASSNFNDQGSDDDDVICLD